MDQEWEDDSLYEEDDVTMSESDGIRYLHFGTEWIQGAMRMSKPNDLVLAYTQQMMTWLLFHEPHESDRLALLGLGAGSLLRYCLTQTPAECVTVEINPQVTAMCRAFFRLPDHVRSEIVHDDAAEWVANAANHNQHVVMMVDLYDAAAQGPVCSSVEFYENCKQCLDKDGIMVVNLFGSHPSFELNVRNIRQVFDNKVLVLPEIDEGNTIVLAFKGRGLETTTQQLMDRAETVQSQYKLEARRWAKALLATRPVDTAFTISET
ncbi:MAG: fused MFS/spermidine synthase [Paenalcaligenes sp.]